jgi:pimeloyl-ACP methyl ester carboxylesterase
MRVRFVIVVVSVADGPRYSVRRDMDTIEIPVGEMTFSARASGPADGRLVLLLHGFPQTSWAWRHQLAALGEAGYRAVAFDQRGYSPGARPEGVEHYRIGHLVADVIAVADWLGGHQFDLVGHDWGGAVAWQTAGRYPDRLRTLTVASTPHPAAFTSALSAGGGRGGTGDQAQRSSYMEFFQQPEVPEQAFLADDGGGLRNLFLASGLQGDDVEEYVRVLTQPYAMTGALNWYRAASIGDVEGMDPITTPTLYVWSDNDVALGRDAAEATAGHVQGRYRFEVLEGVSHWIGEEAPDRFNPLLLEHLASAD